MVVIGINFENKSYVFTVCKNQRLETATNDWHERKTPSAAEDHQKWNIKNILHGIKKFVIQEDCRESFAFLQHQPGPVSFSVSHMNDEKVDDYVKMAAMLLSKLKADVICLSNEFKTSEILQVTGCVIAVPSYFTPSEQKMLLHAAEIAKLNCCHLVKETTAVAVNYGFYKKFSDPFNVIFVDFGYSAIQVCAYTFNNKSIEMLAESFDLIGGKDIDELLADHFLKSLKIPVLNKEGLVGLLKEVEKLKKKMSKSKDKLTLEIKFLLQDECVLPSMKRSEMDELCQPFYGRIEKVMRDCLKDSGLSLSDIHVVEMVGGSSRIPAILDLIEKVFQKTPQATIKMCEAVSRWTLPRSKIDSNKNFLSEPFYSEYYELNSIDSLTTQGEGEVESGCKYLARLKYKGDHKGYFFVKRQFFISCRQEEMPPPTISRSLLANSKSKLVSTSKSCQSSLNIRSTSKYAIGIELGRVNSRVGVFRSGHVEIIPNSRGSRKTPSMVAVTERGQLVGEEAKHQINNNWGNTLYDAKILIGRSYVDVMEENFLNTWPFDIVEVDGCPRYKVSNNGKEEMFTPEEISAAVLSKMKISAEYYLNDEVTHAVITVPAHFNDSQLRATTNAAEIAGLAFLQLINEPTAAAIAYGLTQNIEADQNILVFDMGEDIFDVSILTITPSMTEVKAVGGDNGIGGNQFNYRIFDYFVAEIENLHGVDILSDKTAIGRLQQQCEKAKITLSTSSVAEVQVNSLFNGTDFKSGITRSKFEDLNADLFQKAISIVEDTIVKSSIQKSDIRGILLAGGSTHIPIIQKMLKDCLNCKNFYKQINPVETVVIGAAIFASILST